MIELLLRKHRALGAVHYGLLKPCFSNPRFQQSMARAIAASVRRIVANRVVTPTCCTLNDQVEAMRVSIAWTSLMIDRTVG